MLEGANGAELNTDAVISLTQEDWNRISDVDLNNTEDIGFLDSLGITPGMGDVIVEANGEKQIMVTKASDFGTMYTIDTVRNVYGEMAMDLLK